MLLYTSEQLRSFNHECAPIRSIRKAIFERRLWKPRQARVRATQTASRDLPAGHTFVHTTSNNNNMKFTSDRADDFKPGSASLYAGWLNVRSLPGKAHAVNEVIVDKQLDVLVLCETWHHSTDDVCLRRAAPENYSVIDAVRASDPAHGGIAMYYRSDYTCAKIPLPPVSTFEGLCVRIGQDIGESRIFLSIYRPGSVRPSMRFYDELRAIFESLALHGCPVIVGGDFNIHVEDPGDPDSIRLADLLSSFGMVQHVSGATHELGGTLDCIITFTDAMVEDVRIDAPGAISDHGLVTCRLPLIPRVTKSRIRSVRGWRNVDRTKFREAIRNSPLGRVPSSTDATELFHVYHTVLAEIADRFAPAHTIRSRGRPLSPWFDAECRAIRRNCRMLERRYRRTQLVEDRLVWVTAIRRKHADFKKKESRYWTDRIAMDRGKPSKLWQSISKLLKRNTNTGTTSPQQATLSADGFQQFFMEKVAAVRSATAGFQKPEFGEKVKTGMGSFNIYSADEVYRIIMKSPSKSCSQDPIPTFLVKECIDVLLPFLTEMCNASLREGHLPISQRHAVITPILKKSSLDPGDVKNYRPVSNLTFMSKIVERMVSEQMVDYLQANNLMPRLQSAYRKHHSTETALLRILSDLLNAMDGRCVSLLGLLDLSAAFDTVDHDILLQRLHLQFGFDGEALRWIRSFLTNRTQQVRFNGTLSEVAGLDCSVPQGSALGPLLFLLYTAGLFDIIEQRGLTAHSYADDTQIYISIPAVDAPAAADRFVNCVEDVEQWMGINRLKMNVDKTQLIWIGTRQQLSKISINELRLLSAMVPFSSKVTNLGVIVDGELRMEEHITERCKSCYFQLRQLRQVRRSLTLDARKTLVHAFISSRLDYCNSLLSGVRDGLLKRLQSVQNAAARFIVGLRKFDHISPVLQNLHWLPIRKRISFKIAMLVFKCLHGLAPPYLSEDCVPVSSLFGRAHLRSASSYDLIWSGKSSGSGLRTFAVAGPRTWNSLPAELRAPGLSIENFRKRLKSFLFLSA